MSKASLGIFDSGFGGLTVFKAIHNLLPYENIIYFGDTARLPYGNKSNETIRRYSLENAHLLTHDFGVKALVVACNTACCCALEELQQTLPIPVIGVIQPTIQNVLQLEIQRIAILATATTIRSGVYQNLIYQYLPSAVITPIACPLFVSLIEEGYLDHPLTILAIHEYVKPLQHQDIDTLVLACTHFPLLKTQIQKALPSLKHVIDPAEFCAQLIKKQLSEQQILNTSQEAPHYQFFVSDDPEKFYRLSPIFLGHPIPQVSLLSASS